ncbi:MAG: hypothetical protein HC800_09645 [Phormidesmis sp. RL_2_1]|nr:hypothetical protein [Phormidesmis sp. RL_2_1]
MQGQPFVSWRWKPLKWGIISLLALAIALWFSSSAVPALASPDDQAVFKIGGDLIVSDSQTVQDAFAIGGDVIIEKDVTVLGDTFAIGGNLQLKENARIEGDAFAVGGTVIRAENAVVNGSEFTVLEEFSGVFNRFGVLGTLYLTNLVFWLVSFAVATIAGLLLLLLLPGHIEEIATAVQLRPLASLVYGIGGVAALAMVTVLTAGSAIGSIFIPLANLAVLITGLFGGTAICVWLGRRLQKPKTTAHGQHSLQHHFQHFWLGLILLLVISLIPLAGGLLVSLMTLFGFGATLLARYGTQSADTLPVQLDRLEHQSLEHQPE